MKKAKSKILSVKLLFVDWLILLCSMFCSILLRFEFRISDISAHIEIFLVEAVVVVFFYGILFFPLKYRRVLRKNADILKISLAVALLYIIAIGINILIDLFTNILVLPISVFFISFSISLIGIFAVRISTVFHQNPDVNALLQRDRIKMDLSKMFDIHHNKTVFVTGGGGSIGSELCRQIAAHSPKRLIIFDIYENSAYELYCELKTKYPELELETLIGSVRDETRIDQVFATYDIDIVYHAAAHKHVPLMEDSPGEAIKNNVLGTLNIVKAAHKYNVDRFVLISTDKAVNPTSVMGATKRCCEMIVQYYNSISNTDYVAVRFGNVLDSNGSVVPFFRRQIASGGPVRLTHPEMARYFMTIPEAVSLVITAGASAKGGEIFVLDMGNPVKIIELAENMIRLFGYMPYVDIDIKIVGPRPGEKLYEELHLEGEDLSKTNNELIYILKSSPPTDDFPEKLDELIKASDTDKNNIRISLSKLVNTYHIPENL